MVWPNQAKSIAGKNIVIGDLRKDDKIEKTLSLEIVLNRFVDGQQIIKITIKSSDLGVGVKTPAREQKGDVIVIV